MLRLALGFEFLWAFLDKLFGLGFSTPSADAWIRGGSPTAGFLSHVDSGPFQTTAHSIANSPVAAWAFMMGLLGIGVALILGVAIRAATLSGVLMLALMWLTTWPLASAVGGQATGSTNPLVDDHVISALALIVVAAFAVQSVHGISRWWYERPMVRRHAWLR